MNHKGRRAFTLVELLVAIAIIAVLAALIVSYLGRSRSKAKLAAELSNLKQIGAGFIVFESDTGRFPYSQEDNGSYWDQALVEKNCVADASVFASPADLLPRTDKRPTVKKRSYVINAMVASKVDANGNTPGTTNPGFAANVARYGIGGNWLRADRERSKVVVLHLRPTEVNNFNTGGSLIIDSPNLSPFLSRTNANLFLPLSDLPKGLAASYLFGDGHVEIIDLRQVGTGTLQQRESWMSVNRYRAKN